MIDALILGPRPSRLGTYVVPLTVQEDHRWANEVTRFPVETGGSFSDNIIPQPEECTIEGFVSNNDADDLATATGPTLVAQALEALRSLYQTRLPVTIAVGFVAYTDMALVALGLPRDATMGRDTLRFTATFQSLRLVTGQTTSIPASALPPDTAAGAKGTAGARVPGATPKGAQVPNPYANVRVFRAGITLGFLS